MVISVRRNRYTLQSRIVVEGGKQKALCVDARDLGKSVVEANGILGTWDNVNTLFHAAFLSIGNGKNTVSVSSSR